MSNPRKLLYISYFHPPVSGTGVPAMNRIKKFLKYVPAANNIILTVKPEFYPKHIDFDHNHSKLHDEVVFRTRTWNPFSPIFTLKDVIRSHTKRKDQPQEAEESPAFTANNNLPTSRWSKFTDRVSSLMTYPDSEHAWMLPAIQKGISLVRKENIDIVLATGFPWTSLIVGAFIGKFTKAKLISDFRDPWVNNPYVTREEMVQKLDRKAEHFVVRQSDLVLLNTENLLHEFQNRYPAYSKKLMSLSNGYDPDDFQGLPDKDLPSNQLNLAHAGTLYLKRDPASLLQALSESDLKKKDIFLYQMGRVNLDYDFEQYCQELGVAEYINDMDHMPYKDCLGYMKASDVLVLIQPDTKTQIPSKLYEYIYFNKPILAIAEPDGALGKMIRAYNFGHVFRPDNVQGIKDYLKELSNKKKQGEMIEYDYDKQDFDARNIAQSLSQRIESLFA